MKLDIFVKCMVLFESVSCLLTGSDRVSYHEYSKLNPNQIHTMCEVKTGEVDISRVTAVKQLPKDECGACLKVTAKGKSVYIMAIDMGGAGLDLSEEAFGGFTSPSAGRLPAEWTQVPISNCWGIYSGKGTIGHLKEYSNSYQPNQKNPTENNQGDYAQEKQNEGGYSSDSGMNKPNNNPMDCSPQCQNQSGEYQSQGMDDENQSPYMNEYAGRDNINRSPYNQNSNSNSNAYRNPYPNNPFLNGQYN